MARSRSAMNLERDDEPIRGAALSPVRVVRRELVSPSGSKVVVDVPVYPPFRLASEEERERSRGAARVDPGDGPQPAGDAEGDSADDPADDPADDRAGSPPEAP